MKMIDGHARFSASDLSNFLGCRHLTRLDTLAATGALSPARSYDIGFEKLIARGEEHERAVLSRFRADGLDVFDVPQSSESEAAKVTRDALASGVAVIYQGVLKVDAEGGSPALLGRPDFLVRSEVLPQPSDSARDSGRHYEVVDAKLARTAKARAVLQTAFYSTLLESVQGVAPQRMHLALGDGELSSFRVADFAAYERRMRMLLQEFVAADASQQPPADTYPEPVEHCAICRWSSDCDAQRRSDDDLSLVAGMPTAQRLALKAVHISTRRGFAAMEALPELGRSNAASLNRAQLQARLQVESEDAGRIAYELLDPERDTEGALVGNRGLLALPEPSDGDLFFDIEGARFYSEDGREFGLQYLFGIVDTADVAPDGTPVYTQIWAFDRRGEKRAFEEVIDFITERRERNPALHVYHYNHYEPTSIDHLSNLHESYEEAVGRLMGRFATHEDDVDDLFRLGVFVDLYRVVRQGIRAGVESYSLKRLEPLMGFERQVGLSDATAQLIALEASLDDGTASHDEACQRVVAGYNEDDCRATSVLRDWLEDRRRELAAVLGATLPRPEYDEPAHDREDPDIVRLKAELLSGVPEEEGARTDEERARVLMADLLEWHRREAKPGWWQYFRLRAMTSTDLIAEREAIGGLAGGDEVDRVKRSVVRRFTFPPQEHGFAPGDSAQDPVSNKTWKVHAVDEANGTIDLRIGNGKDDALPSAVVETGPVNTSVLATGLRELGERVVRDGLATAAPATALLMRRRPSSDATTEGALKREGETSGAAAVRLVVGLNDSYLPIQGPPGTGKTYSGAEAILALTALGQTVGVTAPSHAVIQNLLQEIDSHAAEAGRSLRIGQRGAEDGRFHHPSARQLDYPEMLECLANRELDVVAGTPWLWARADFATAVDVLFVDEAGQMSLANTLAAAGGARNLVLLGDPQQLAQPSQAAHPPGSGVSALEHVLQRSATMPDGCGLLLDCTYRMHPRLCDFTSGVFYDGRLLGAPGLDRQSIEGSVPVPTAAGLHVVEVDHHGNTNSSLEEAAEVARIVGHLLSCTWTDRDGTPAPMTTDRIKVITPYNAQVREIDRALARAQITGVQVGTVDKFQGREAPAVIYSMATSSAEDAPRGLEFLFDLHRLNVATSRAKALGIVVASPDLARVFCRTPHQMQLANALCLAWEC